MPYEIREQRGKKKPFKIIDTVTGQQVGESDTKDKAERSIGYRIEGENKKKGNIRS